MKTDVIYEPKGRAKEYAALACNLFTGCTHGCKYCFAPSATRKSREEHGENVRPRKDILKRLAKDAAKLAEAGCQDEILLCFTCDPYPKGVDTSMTRAALIILGEAGLKATVLTKGGKRAMRDFDLLKEYGFRFGTTLVFASNDRASQEEPGAGKVSDRIAAIHQAHRKGISTWVSLEPVIDPEESLALIDIIHNNVDKWKVGKLNHDKEREAVVDWPKFLADMTAKLDGYGTDYYIKKDLRKAASVGRRRERPNAQDT